MSTTRIVETPVLRRRSHGHPFRGACLVEFAATLPAGVWTDRPPGVQPTLAAVARRVNDRTSDEARIALLPWAAWLVGTGGEEHDEDVDTAIAAHTGAVALRHADPATADRLAVALARTAWPKPAGHGRLHTWRRQMSRRRDRHRVIRLATAALAAAPHPDQALRDLLADTVNLTRRRQHLEPVAVDYTGYQTWPRVQQIEVQVRTPDGAESTYYFCTALPQRWPPALEQAWTARTGELRRVAAHACRS
jgi:hypothetical protein